MVNWLPWLIDCLNSPSMKKRTKSWAGKKRILAATASVSQEADIRSCLCRAQPHNRTSTPDLPPSRTIQDSCLLLLGGWKFLAHELPPSLHWPVKVASSDLNKNVLDHYDCVETPKGQPTLQRYMEPLSDRDFKYKNNTSFPGGPSCSQSFNWLSGQRTHQVSGDRIGQSLSLWQIPGTQRSWMKRCRTPREKEMEERHFMCHIWGLQKSVSSKCQQPVQGENEISCHRSWEALLWLTFNMMLFRSAAQTQCHSHRCHMRNISPSATSGYTTTREAKHARRTTRRDILWPVFFFSLCGKCMCIRGAWGWGIWVGGRIGGGGGCGCQALINRQWFNWHFN